MCKCWSVEERLRFLLSLVKQSISGLRQTAVSWPMYGLGSDCVILGG